MSLPGEVKIKLDGRVVVLRPSLMAAKIVDAYFGGIGNGFSPLRQFNLAAYTAVVAAGLGKKDEEIEDAVYKTGMTNLAGDVSLFLSILTMGGVMPEKKDGGGDRDGDTSSGE